MDQLIRIKIKEECQEVKIIYRSAQFEDWEDVALIHINNWRENYRGILTDDFLDNHVFENRRSLWKSRFEATSENQYILIAQYEEEIIGFACTFLEYKGKSENYLDNLHVKSEYRGKKIGAELLSRSAHYSFENKPNLPFYLLVYNENQLGIAFYKRMGADISDPFDHENEDGSYSQIVKCSWPSLSSLTTP